MQKPFAALILLALAGCMPPRPAVTSPPLPPQPATVQPPTATTEPPPTPLLIDGFFDDWAGTAPLATDPSGDGRDSGVDFTEIAVTHTEDLLVISVDLGVVVNLQSQRALAMTLWAGGPELNYDFARREGTLGDETVSHVEIGLVSMPTVTSDRFEIAVRRDAAAGDLALFAAGSPVSIAFADPRSNGDTVGPFTYAWDNPAALPAPRSPARPDGTIRVVSWNVLNDGLLSSLKEDHFRRILAALQPDIIAFQEIENRTAAAVEERMEEWLGGEWYAVKQADLVTASRWPFVEGWPDTQKPLHARVFPVMIDVDGRSLAVFNAHLYCCDEDEGRQDQADGFAAFVRDLDPGGVPFVLAGDLNLVGDNHQLATLLAGDILDESIFGPDALPDTDGTPLADLVAQHLYTPHTYTWFSAGSDFAPGRLDFVIYTDSLLAATGFVFDPNGLPGDLLAALDVRAHDGLEASDHLPVVADVLFLP